MTRQELKGACRELADAYKAAVRSFSRINVDGREPFLTEHALLMYDPKDPRFMAISLHSLKPFSEMFDEMVEEDGGDRL